MTKKRDEELAKIDARVERMVEKGDVKGLIKSLRKFSGNKGFTKAWRLRKSASKALVRISADDPEKIKGVSFTFSNVESVLVKELKNEDKDVRPNVAKILANLGWKPADDTQSLMLHHAKMDIPALESMGKPAVKRLIEIVSSYNESGVPNAQAAKALGNIGDPVALAPILSYLWQAKGDGVKTTIEALAKVAKSDKKLILKRLANFDLDIESKEEVPRLIWVLCETGDKNCADAVLNCLFRERVSIYTPPGDAQVISPASYFRSLIPDQALKNMFGEYAGLILDLLDWSVPAGIMQSMISYRNVTFDLSKCVDALQALSEINTPVSSNILHKIKNCDKLTVSRSITSSGGMNTTNWIYIDFSAISGAARGVLASRGNPPYDKTAFLKM